jgi:UDP-glucose 4-epimerase
VGQHLLRNLEQDGAGPVVGIDMDSPRYSPPALKYYNLDVRQGYLGDILRRERIKTVIHLAFVLTSPREARLMFDINYNGAKNVLESASAAGVERVVMLSSTAVYGASRGNPRFMAENAALKDNPAIQYIRNMVAIERLAAEFAAVRSTPELAVLRPCLVYGRRRRSFLVDFIRKAPFLPAVPGADPDLQFIHVGDLTRAIRLAAVRGRGPYNIVGSDTVSYSAAAGILKKTLIRMPSPIARATVAALARSNGLKDCPSDIVDFIRYRWAADGTRARDELGFSAAYSSREALESVFNT